MHFFSVIIPLYNKEKSILHTINSVLEQSLQDFEIIVVDDGSSDNSAMKVHSVKDPRVRYVYKDNGGVCSARNLGIKLSKSPYVAFLDADDIWHKDFLYEQKKLIEDFPDAMMFGTNYMEKNSGKPYRKLSTGLPNNYRGYVDNYFTLKNRISDLFCSSSVVINQEVFNKVGYFDERIKYSEDLDMWYRIIANYRVVFFDSFLVDYILDAENRALTRQCHLTSFLPFFCDKYYSYKHINSIFYHYIMNWSAVFIKQYYFNNPNERKDALLAANKLDYNELPKKYKYFFKLPYSEAKVLYLSMEFLLKIKKTLKKIF